MHLAAHLAHLCCTPDTWHGTSMARLGYTSITADYARTWKRPGANTAKLVVYLPNEGGVGAAVGLQMSARQHASTSACWHAGTLAR